MTIKNYLIRNVVSTMGANLKYTTYYIILTYQMY